MEELAVRLREADLPPAGPELFVALDIDGTLVRSDGSLSPRVGRAVAGHLRAGTRMSLATGRGLPGMRQALDFAGMREGVGVCSNGAITVDLDPYRLRRAHTFDPAPELEVLRAALPDAIYMVEFVDEPRRLTADFPPGELTGPSVIVPFEELAPGRATRITVRVPGMDPRELSSIIRGLELTGVDYPAGWAAWVDISPRGVSKAAALQEVREEVGAAATVAAGDGANDVEMLRWATFGVAMGGADPEAVEAADAQTASSDDDGVAILLELLLRRG